MDDVIRGRIGMLRQQRMGTHERNQVLSDMVLAQMMDDGEFVKTHQTQCFYIPTATRQPVYIGKRSDELEMHLCNAFELNGTEDECEFVMASITARTLGQMVVNGGEHTLSAFASDEGALYLHMGADSLLRITQDQIGEVPNGHENMVFQWSKSGDTFHPATNGHSARKWYEYLFHDAVATIEGLEHEEATAILTAWFMFLLFRQLAASRPILATLGAPGSGKSVLMKRIYIMLYGPDRGINSITTPDNFDQAVATNPFVAFDNIDISTRWLPDRLAQVSSVTEIDKRQLYTDKTTIILRREALVGITSHNPEFTRADVADRLLILNLRRWDNHLSEGVILRNLAEARDRLWGGVVNSVQAMLATPRPAEKDAPSMRIQDFAYIGLWAARAIGLADAFDSGLRRLMTIQRTFALSEEQLLIDCIDKLSLPTDWVTASELFRELSSVAVDPTDFRLQYKNAATLGRRMVALTHPLRDFFKLEWRPDHKHGRKWKVSKAG